MEQVLICLKNKDVIKIDLLDARRKELVALWKAISTGDSYSIKKHVSAALDAGASHKDIMKLLAFIIGDKRLLNSILELNEILFFEENLRTVPISILDDVRE